MEKEKKLYIDIENVKNLMQERNLDINTMASLMGLTPPTIKKLLDGADQSNLSGVVIYKIANALNVTADSLLLEIYRHHKNS